MVLIAISLALYLASLIPRGSLYPSRGSRLLLPGKFDLDAPLSLHSLNPQLGMQIIFESNGTLNMKVFDLNYSDVKEWFIAHNGTATALEEFETSHLSVLTLARNIQSGNTTFEYVPPKIENATVIVSNPTSAAVRWSFDSKDIEVIASPERVSLALMIAAPLGVVLTVPRIVLTLEERWKIRKTATHTSARAYVKPEKPVAERARRASHRHRK